MTILDDQSPAPSVDAESVDVPRAARATPVDALRTLIGEGGYAPGDRLPAERELIVTLGLTRSALRKALEALEREGAIWRHVGKGTFISSGPQVTATGGLADISRQITPIKMMRARLSIEPALTREAAVNASSEAIARIDAARRAAISAATWDEYEAQDDHFHRAVAEAADNILLMALFDQLNQVRRAVAWGNVVRDSVAPAPDHTSFAEHDRITEAVAARDPATAEDAMRRHLRSVSGRLFGEA